MSTTPDEEKVLVVLIDNAAWALASQEGDYTFWSHALSRYCDEGRELGTMMRKAMRRGGMSARDILRLARLMRRTPSGEVS